MTSMTGVPQTAILTALCCECGEPRTVSKRGTANRRPLRCSACKGTTTHAVIGSSIEDWREEQNRKDDATLVKIARDVDHLDRLGIWVTDGKAEGGRCDVRRYIDGDSPEWRVVIQTGLSAAERLRAVEWAWKAMLPSWVKDYDHTWNGPLCTDEYGDFRGCYYTPKR